MKQFYFILLFLYTSLTIGQTFLEGYKEERNSINLTIRLEKVNLLSLKAQKENKIIGKFFDIGNPGEYALPSKDIFIAVPYKSEINIKAKIIESDYYKFNLGVNPKPILLNDSTTSFSFKNLKLKQTPVKPTVELLGFLWIDNIYCAHVRVNQYSYNDRENKITEIEKLSLQIDIKNNLLKKQITNSAPDEENLVNKAIINYRYANKFKIKRKIENDSTFQWIDFSKDYLKIGTSKDGIYRIYKNDLEKYNISSNTVDPKSFKMFLKGKEIPIYVNGENDGTFDDNDFIEFFGERNMGGHHREVSEYGQPYNEYLGRYTDTTIYWLTWNGKPGKRVKTNSHYLTFADTLEYYNKVIHQEKNAWFDFGTVNGDIVRREKPFWTENKTWGWGGLKGGSVRTYRFLLNDIYPNKPAYLLAKLQSYASIITTDAHLLALSLNSGDIIGDTTRINKYAKVVLKSEINSNELNSGTNNLKVHSFTTSSSINLCFFDWAEIEYPRYLKTFNDSINFQFPFLTGKTKKEIKITNVQTNDLILWKKGKTYERYLVEKINNQIIFSDTISSIDKFVLLPSSKVKSPTIYYKKKFKNLRDRKNQADYIAITHKKFLSKTIEYAQMIEAHYNVKTMIVDIDDIYDEFGYGFFNPETIKEFLKITHANWLEPYPKYVALIGDATYDYHHNKEKYLGLPHVSNYVPSFGAPVSDNWFVMWDTTNAFIPQMNIGRLPVKEVDELDRYLERHKNYVEAKYDDWNKNYLFFSGGTGDNQSELNLLSSANKYVINNYAIPAPIGGNVHHFYKTINPTTNFGPFKKSEIKKAIEDGAVFISYIGHSGTRTWDNSITEPEHLNNIKNRAPLVTDYGCSTGKFAESDIISYAELFLLADNSQGIAYIGNSSLGFTGTATFFPKLFYKQVLVNSIYNISEALKLAKIELLNTSNSKSYQLFALTNTLIGDPIVSLPIPSKPNLTISNESIVNISDKITDADKFSKIKIIYKNLGKVTDDSISIYLQDFYNNSENFTQVFKRRIPNFLDTLVVNIPINNKPGKHQIIVKLDNDNKIDEIYEDDNEIKYDIIIASSSTRTTLSYNLENVVDSTLIVLSPSSRPESELLQYELSENHDFDSPTNYKIKIDSFYTKINFSSLNENQRYWLRSKLESEQNYSVVKSFYKKLNLKYLLNDSLSFSNSKKDNLFWNKNLTLDTASIVLSVSSAGYYEGRSALIYRNDTNYVPQNYRTGHHIVLFDKDKYTFEQYKYFNTYSGGTTVLDEYKNFLDTLSNKYLIFIAVSDDGRIRDAALREKLKSIGSKYIDSLKFRSSWAIIGYKGAVSGSVPEAFSNPTEGSVKLDTLFKQLHKTGKFVSNIIGPATNWHKLFISDSTVSNSNINFSILGYTDNNIDTLTIPNISNGMNNISFLNNKNYSSIQLVADFTASTEYRSPILKSIGINYVGIPEIGTNYQVVSIKQDSVEQGNNVELAFYVYNVGETTARNFKVQVDVIKPDNSKEKIFEQVVDSLGVEKRKHFDVSYNTTSFNGRRTFSISIDTENKIQELYEDNNYFTIPFFVKGDTTKPSLNITFNGNDIFDGEYISNKPNIKIELNEPSLMPITDTNSVTLFLNNKLIPYKNNDEVLSINYSQTNPKVVVNYTPTLDDGEYKLKVFGKDASGNVADSSGISKSFVVQSKPKILDVYNYPNPMTNDTYFTFKLTQVPDEIRIRIFTIAGRMIKEIKLNNSELHYDLNKIYWDGRDGDGDQIANGTYLYKIIMDMGGKKQTVTKKLAIVK